MPLSRALEAKPRLLIDKPKRGTWLVTLFCHLLGSPDMPRVTFFVPFFAGISAFADGAEWLAAIVPHNRAHHKEGCRCEMES